MPAGNTGFASDGVTCKLEAFVSYQVQYWQTVLCHETRIFAKRQNVTSHHF